MVMNALEKHPGSVYTGHHDGRSRSRPYRHGPITQKTTISNLNIVHFSCIVSLLQKVMSTCQAIQSAAVLHYTLVSVEMCRRKYNVK